MRSCKISIQKHVSASECSKHQNAQEWHELLQPASNCVVKECPHFRTIFRYSGEKQNIFCVGFKFGCYPSQTLSKINFINSIFQLTLNMPINPVTARCHKDLYKHRSFSKTLLSNTDFQGLRCKIAHKGSRWDWQSIFPCMLQISVHNTKKGIMSGE